MNSSSCNMRSGGNNANKRKRNCCDQGEYNDDDSYEQDIIHPKYQEMINIFSVVRRFCAIFFQTSCVFLFFLDVIAAVASSHPLSKIYLERFFCGHKIHGTSFFLIVISISASFKCIKNNKRAHKTTEDIR